MNYHLTILGRPQPKQRPRTVQNDGKAHTYTPSETQQKEGEILAEWLEKYGQVELEGNLTLTATFVYKKGPYADVSNLLKLVEDALGGGHKNLQPFNDKQIVSIHAHREKGEEAKTEITITERDKE